MDGTESVDVLVDEFDRELVKFEVNVFWVAIGGRDPIDAMKKLRGRVAQVHLKDLQRDAQVQHDEALVPHEAFKELGNGSIDMKTVLKVSAEIDADQCHVEQDQSADPVVSIRQSMDHLRTT